MLEEDADTRGEKSARTTPDIGMLPISVQWTESETLAQNWGAVVGEERLLKISWTSVLDRVMASVLWVGKVRWRSVEDV
jgi:hypothetical protein